MDETYGTNVELHCSGRVVALTGVSQRRWLGALMIVVAGLMKVKERKQYDEERKDPEKRNQQEPKEPEGHQKSEGHDSRLRNDKYGTRRKSTNPQTPEEVLGMVLEDRPKCWLSKNSEEVEMRGVAPGLRAMRISQKDFEGSQGPEAMDHGKVSSKGARARGAAALGGRQDAMTPGGLQGAMDGIEGAHEKGRKEVPIEVDMAQLTEDVELRLHLRGESFGWMEHMPGSNRCIRQREALG